MRKRIILIICALLAVIALGLAVYVFFFKDRNNKKEEITQDLLLMEAKVGKKSERLGYRLERGKRKKKVTMGPNSFSIGEDEKTYISDPVKKRISVYSKNQYLYGILVPFATDIGSICVSEDLIYFVDGAIGGKIYGINRAGSIMKEISLPATMEGYITESLFKTEDGRMALVCYSQEGSRAEEDEGDVYESYTYLLDELEKGNIMRVKGYARNFSDGAVLNGTKLSYIGKDAELRSELNKDLTEGRVIGIDKEENIYVDVYESAKTQTLAGENTVQRFKDGVCTGMFKIKSGGSGFTPRSKFFLTDDGELYLMSCLKDRINISQKAFQPPEQFKSDMKTIERKAQKRDKRLR